MKSNEKACYNGSADKSACYFYLLGVYGRRTELIPKNHPLICTYAPCAYGYMCVLALLIHILDIYNKTWGDKCKR